MNKIIRIGLDTSKSVFQLHGVDASEQPVLRKKLSRGQLLDFFAKQPPLMLGLEACSASHFWAREIVALGHEVVLVPPQYVKPYVKRNKTDAADAEAICEAMSRPTMRFAAVKTPDEQADQMFIRLREQFVRRRTQLANAIRGYASEFGFVAPKGLSHLPRLLENIRSDHTLPDLAVEMFETLADDFAHIDTKISDLDKRLMAQHLSNEMSKRLSEMPGIGPVGAVLLVSKFGVVKNFRSGRDFAAWLGLTPKNHSTAGKNRLGVITRAGDERLRSVLVAGATAVIAYWRRAGKKEWPWLEALMERKPAKLAAVALANKMARMAWKMMVSGERYCPPSFGASAA